MARQDRLLPGLLYKIDLVKYGDTREQRKVLRVFLFMFGFCDGRNWIFIAYIVFHLKAGTSVSLRTTW